MHEFHDPSPHDHSVGVATEILGILSSLHTDADTDRRVGQRSDLADALLHRFTCFQLQPGDPRLRYVVEESRGCGDDPFQAIFGG
jgi:hypothetical protein